MNLGRLVVLLLTTAHTTYGAIYQNFDNVPSGRSYDFVVAGGGTAGCKIKFRVLVLEAGQLVLSNEGVVELEAPGLTGSTWLTSSQYNWNYTTVPQVGLNGRSLPYIRGYVLGGSSSINGMVYARGSADDYNRWAAVTGNEGWSWKEMLRYILKNERFTSPGDGHSTVGQFDPAYHNFTGMTFVLSAMVQGAALQHRT
ncbi:hypothetical protein BDQ17DRAFT_1372716 [Cyathus striatus]|nr:hypothetical protein BDQ17DRAFT_1372716 [Cyathus striatus]